jgi:hypothetical protein
MSKIEKLTPEQEKGIVEWRDHCLKIGRDISPVNRPMVEKSWKKFYKMLNMSEPKFWYCQSPLQAQIIINIFPEIQKAVGKIYDIKLNKGANIWDNIGANIRANIRANIWDNIWDNIRANIRANIWDNIWDNIGDNIWANIWANIGANIGANIRANIRANIWDNIRANIWANIGANIGANIWDNIWDNIRDNIWANIWDNIGDNIGANIRANIGDTTFSFIDTYSWCQHDINWIAYYKYFEKYGLLPHDKNFEIFDIWYDLACSCGWCYTFEGIVFVCEKPSKLYLDEQGRLHKNSSMALEYSDGYGLWMLWGVRVPRWLAETPEGQLNPDEILKIENAEQRMVGLRKFGVERLKKYGEIKDKQKTYELVDMTKLLPSGNYAPYLYMVNPSTGTIHAEGVHPKCKTVGEALAWRNGTEEEPKVLT